jgi:hypothetical protein
MDVVAAFAARRGKTAGAGNHRRLAAHQLRRQCRQLIAVSVRPAIFDCHVATLDLASLGEPLHEGAQALRERFGRLSAEIGDDLRCGFLREGGQRQAKSRSYCSSELPASHPSPPGRRPWRSGRLHDLSKERLG